MSKNRAFNLVVVLATECDEVVWRVRPATLDVVGGQPALACSVGHLAAAVSSYDVESCLLPAVLAQLGSAADAAGA
jgi:hypothetical protein